MTENDLEKVSRIAHVVASYASHVQHCCSSTRVRTERRSNCFGLEEVEESPILDLLSRQNHKYHQR